MGAPHEIIGAGLPFFRPSAERGIGHPAEPCSPADALFHLLVFFLRRETPANVPLGFVEVQNLSDLLVEDRVVFWKAY